MSLLSSISEKWKGCKEPFLVHSSGQIAFSDIENRVLSDLSVILPGQVVALIGDFDPISILTLFELIERRAIILPLTMASVSDHEYFFEVGLVDFVIQNGSVLRRVHDKKHEYIGALKKRGSPGLIAFSTGTTGRPKAILHDFNVFLKRFETKRPALKTINFLTFDHIGGLNTLFHTLFNGGLAIIPDNRSIDSILTACKKYSAEVLPTTPTFLRMMLMSGLIPDQIPSCLKIITYGSERMDQQTLDHLCALLPHIDFRQTYGTSELGVVRVKSESRNSLFIKIGDLGLEIKVSNRILY